MLAAPVSVMLVVQTAQAHFDGFAYLGPDFGNVEPIHRRLNVDDLDVAELRDPARLRLKHGPEQIDDDDDDHDDNRAECGP